MKKGRRCIICNKPIGTDGFLGNIKDIKVSFCGKHSDECKQNCDSCVHANVCPVIKSRSEQAL